MQHPATPVLPQAVLWDMDGTLVDSEPLWIASEIELMAQHGLAWTHEDALAMVGMALPNSAAILQDAGLPLATREILDFLIGRVLDGLRRSVTWRPGALELLGALHAAGVPQGLVTMSERPLADALVEGLEAELGSNPFDAIVTGDVVERGKPDPDPYLLGLALLGERHGEMDASRVVAIEDSKPGTASALASGVVTLGIPFMQSLPALEGLHQRESLAGVGPEELGALLAAPAPTA